MSDFQPISEEKIEELQLIWHTLSVPDKQKFMKLIEASRNYSKTHATLCYKPHGKQKAFHIAPNVGRGIFGGNQSGKTYSGTMEVGFHATQEYPDWYPKKLYMPPGNVGRIVVKDFPKSVSEVMEPALLRIIHPRFIKYVKRNSQGYMVKVALNNECRFDLVTHEMDTQSLEGWQGDWCYFDEPCPRDKFIACLRGLIRRSGRWWLSCTPLTEPWMYDEIYTNPKIFTVTVDITDNPHLKEEDIKVFVESLTEDEKEARLHGKFMHLSGLVYPEFSVETHVRPSTTMIPLDWPRRLLVDPHDRRPFAMAWMAVDPLDRLWFYREWPLEMFHKLTTSRRSVRDYCHIIREAEGSETIYRRLMDSRFGKQPKMQVEGYDMSEQPNLFDMFDSEGLVFEPSYWTQTLSAADPGHQAIKERLRVSPVTGEPSLFVLDNCKNLIYAFQHNVWMRDKERQEEFAKDFLDLARFGAMDEPKYFQPEGANFGRSQWAKQNNKLGFRTYGGDVND